MGLVLVRGVVVVCLVLGGTRLAAGDERTDQARAHVVRAVDAYDKGLYEDAARELNVAYALRPLPDIQYNLAQCYERLNKLQEAIAAYQLYSDGEPGASDHDVVLERIASLRDRVKNGQAAPPPAERVVLKTIVVYREAPPKPGRAARWAAYGAWTLTAGALASAIAFTVLAKQAANAVTSGGNIAAPPTFAGPIAATQDSGKIDPVLAGVSFGVAAITAAGGVALFLIGRRIDREAPRLTLAPNLSRTGAGLVAAWRF